MKVRFLVIFNKKFNDDFAFDPGPLLQDHYKVNFFFFQMKTHCFDTANRKSGQFYVLMCINVQGQIKLTLYLQEYCAE